MAGWIKALHDLGDGWTVEPGQETWVSDVGQHDQQGRRKFRADGVPWGEPSWKLGDLVGLYFSGTLRVPLLVEVIAAPAFDPDRPRREGGDPTEGERWPWVTEIRGLAARPLAQAPTLTDLGIDHSSMKQRSRLLLTPEQHGRMISLFRR